MTDVTTFECRSIAHINVWLYMHAHRIARYRIYLFIWKSICFRPWHSWTIGSRILYTQPWTSHQIRKIAGYACAENSGNVFPATDLKENRYLDIQAYITARKWPLSDLSDDGYARAVMHVGIANPRWRGKRSLHSRRMRNPQFFSASDKSLIVMIIVPFITFLKPPCQDLIFLTCTQNWNRVTFGQSAISRRRYAK